MAAQFIYSLAFLSLLGFIQAADPNCENITKPLELEDDYSSIMGKWIFSEAIANHESFTSFINLLNSSWIEFAPSSQRDAVLFSQRNKLNGTCEFKTMNSTIKNSTSYADQRNVPVQGYFLPSCPDCFTISFTNPEQNGTIRALYLFTRSPKVSENDKDLYWKQAACFGFKKEPQFSYDGVTEFCKDEKIIPPTEQIKPEDKKED